MKRIICVLIFSIILGSSTTMFAAEKEPRGLNVAIRTDEEWEALVHITDYLNSRIYDEQGNDEKQQVLLDAFFDVVNLYYYEDDVEVTIPTCVGYLLNHGITYTQSWQ